jgi:hypothetical protein
MYVLYVCVHVHIYTYVYVCMYVYKYACLRVCMCVCMHACTHKRTFTHPCTYTHTHTYTNIHTSMHTHTCMHAHTHTHEHSHIHACTHTFTHAVQVKGLMMQRFKAHSLGDKDLGGKLEAALDAGIRLMCFMLVYEIHFLCYSWNTHCSYIWGSVFMYKLNCMENIFDLIIQRPDLRMYNIMYTYTCTHADACAYTYTYT